jgi:cellulose synthase/poly-beta-1,6-N-acetylglucosamine synthase-like glycosyltransferase
MKNRDQFRPTCTVVICTRDRPAELNRCLKALAELDYPYFDVLVVDNAPSDDQARQVATRWGAAYVVEPVPGLSCARNLGAMTCTAEVVAYVDDDALAEPNWLSILMQEFKDPLVMAVTGSIKALKVETEAERLCALLAGSQSERRERRVVDSQTPRSFEIANFGGIGDGGNMAFRRTAFQVWPGFDERLGRGAVIDGGEEQHAFFSLLQGGFRVAHVPHAVVSHPFPRDIEELRRRKVRDLTSAAAYVTLLCVEEPHHLPTLIKCVLERFSVTPRSWRNAADQSRPVPVSRPRRLLALLCGPLLYVRSLLERRHVPLRSPAQLLVDRLVASESGSD